MKALDEQIKKIIRLYMMNCGDDENITVLKIQELIAKWFLYGVMLGLFFGILMSQL